MSDDDSPPDLSPHKGWHVLHLYYHIDHAQWALLTKDEQLEAKTDFSELVQEIRAEPETQLLTGSVLTPKADLSFLLTTPNLQTANAFEKRLSLSLGPDILNPTYFYLSQTEGSEYIPTTEQYAAESLAGEKKLDPKSPEYQAILDSLNEFTERMEKHLHRSLYPTLPDWPIHCFYPTSKRRLGNDNWYSLPFDKRRDLMKAHATLGRAYTGRIIQIITGSTGLDDYEWGVTLFAKNPADIKSIVYEMRFDEVSARYVEFGEFYISLQLPLNQLFERLCL